MTDAPKKKVTRTQKPLYALVTVKDDAGNIISYPASQVTVNLERNADKIIELLQGGDSQGATLVRADMPTVVRKTS